MPYRKALRDAGLKVTLGRLAVLDALGSAPHSSAENVFQAVAGQLDTSIQSVHNILNDLSAAHLVRRIEPAHSPARYELRVADNHHHLVCRTCGRIEDVDCVVGSAPCLTPSDDHGFDVSEAEVTFWGACPACMANPTTSDQEKK
ncbi:MAG: transcriptional repressor [Propionibacteriaceae bacterium]|jgi:Fur family ferric uptake transcriptional regulator|nr:transcriptional repressor [Propionibacteriaceae bacterium]